MIPMRWGIHQINIHSSAQGDVIQKAYQLAIKERPRKKRIF